MEFTFSEEQEALRTSVRAVVDDAVAAGAVRGFVDGRPDAAGESWRRMVELGGPALLVPERCGGLGLGLVDAVVVLEETGRAALPGPFLSSAVVATRAADALGCDDLLADLAAGARRGTVALEESGHDDPVDRVRTRANRRGAAWELTGEKPIVFDPDASWVIVAARTGEGLASFLIDSPQFEAVTALDPTRAVGRLRLDGTAAALIGPPGDHTRIWRELADVAAIALAAELVGVCDAAFAAAVAYGQARVQFDQPIASHQVIQHKFVDMLHRFELGRVGVHHAVWSFDVGDAGRSESAAIAKSAMGAAAVFVTAENIQVHGAVGFTWEADPQLHFKRAKQNDALYGARSWQERRIADAFLDA